LHIALALHDPGVHWRGQAAQFDPAQIGIAEQIADLGMRRFVDYHRVGFRKPLQPRRPIQRFADGFELA
jgi:hypothetical protein